MKIELDLDELYYRLVGGQTAILAKLIVFEEEIAKIIAENTGREQNEVMKELINRSVEIFKKLDDLTAKLDENRDMIRLLEITQPRSKH